MVKHKLKTISFYEETQQKLDEITEKTGLRESEIIREMIYKAVEDPVELTILMQNFLNREKENLGKERLLRIMSIRKSLKKGAGTQRPEPVAVSIDDQKQYSIPWPNDKIDNPELERIIEEAKKKWTREWMENND